MTVLNIVILSLMIVVNYQSEVFVKFNRRKITKFGEILGTRVRI